jgi:2-polyprenyl-3-methyl-5-hydroxy-6-metoxy-1,4-benzoquinol methylase
MASSTLTPVTARHPLQPKDWKSGSHAERFERVRRYVEGRTVLDVGAGSGIDRPDWMHAAVAAVAVQTVGVELDRKLAAQARERGYDVIAGDAEALDLGRTFEVVWAGELIEHLSCAGGFLDGARRHLEPGGRLVLTTPNAFAVSNFVYRIGGRPRVNRGHTCWYDETTLSQLLDRHGYDVAEISYLPHKTPGRIRALLAGAVRAMLPRHLAENTLLVVATPR